MPITKKAPKKNDEIEEIVPAKIKKEFDIETPEVFAIDKSEEAEVLPADPLETDELDDEVELDAEELNPFGDKWEE